MARTRLSFIENIGMVSFVCLVAGSLLFLVTGTLTQETMFAVIAGSLVGNIWSNSGE